MSRKEQQSPPPPLIELGRYAVAVTERGLALTEEIDADAIADEELDVLQERLPEWVEAAHELRELRVELHERLVSVAAGVEGSFDGGLVPTLWHLRGDGPEAISLETTLAVDRALARAVQFLAHQEVVLGHAIRAAADRLRDASKES